ncbi:hypothetical protein BofuT4_P045570.1 [Botrytis cinerea T4]|uniref:Uncharacterized protein n=1 Tax=Botryotinia fuckeliana (strain T4) TaxID=999810 RepID=G2XYK2_BOTF4|nr:hypothetical protein BofuT4_P045570.1 [Botrytis cinerea T4]
MCSWCVRLYWPHFFHRAERKRLHGSGQAARHQPIRSLEPSFSPDRCWDTVADVPGAGSREANDLHAHRFVFRFLASGFSRASVPFGLR